MHQKNVNGVLDRSGKAPTKKKGEKGRGKKRGKRGNLTQKLRYRKENYNLKLNLHAEKEQ